VATAEAHRAAVGIYREDFASGGVIISSPGSSPGEESQAGGIVTLANRPRSQP
jgi:hypothetical protein